MICARYVDETGSWLSLATSPAAKALFLRASQACPFHVMPVSAPDS